MVWSSCSPHLISAQRRCGRHAPIARSGSVHLHGRAVGPAFQRHPMLCTPTDSPHPSTYPRFDDSTLALQACRCRGSGRFHLVAADQSRLIGRPLDRLFRGLVEQVSAVSHPRVAQTLNMTGLLAATENADLSKIEQRAPSVAQMFLDRVAATPHAEAFRSARGWLEERHWQQLVTASPPRGRADLAGHRARGARRAGVLDTLRMGPRRLRGDVRGCRDHHGVPDDQRRRRRLHRRELGQPGRGRRGPGPGRQAARAPRRAPRRADGGGHRRPGRRRLGDHPRRTRAARRAGCWPSPRARSTNASPASAGAAGQHHLHLRHHRYAEGGAGHARGVDLHGRGDRRGEYPRSRRPGLPVAAAGARRSAR